VQPRALHSLDSDMVVKMGLEAEQEPTRGYRWILPAANGVTVPTSAIRSVPSGTQTGGTRLREQSGRGLAADPRRRCRERDGNNACGARARSTTLCRGAGEDTSRLCRPGTEGRYRVNVTGVPRDVLSRLYFRNHLAQWLGAVGIGCLILFRFTAAAHGAEVTLTGAELRVSSDGQERNVVDVTINDFGYDVADGRAPLQPGFGCVAASPRHVRCVGFVLRVTATLDGGNDAFVAKELYVPVSARGGEGDDYLVGGQGPDSLDGDEGEDTLVGGPGVDQLEGEGEADALLGGDGRDVVTGGLGTDYARGHGGDDVLLGGEEADFMRGGPGNDEVNGQDGDDALFDRAGDNRLEGGPGADSIRAADERGTSVDCGLGAGDRLSTATEGATGCESTDVAVPYPEQWPPAGRSDAAGAASCHIIACVNRVAVDLHTPPGRPRYFSARAHASHFSCARIAVWGTRNGKRVQEKIVKRRWPTDERKRVRPERPAARATAGRGELRSRLSC
jgi:hypothetical protein